MVNRFFNFHQTFFNNSYCNMQFFCYIISTLKFLYSRQHWQSLHLIPHGSHFLLSRPYLHLIIKISSARLSARFDNEFTMKFVLSINCNFWYMVFVISSPFLPILLTHFVIGIGYWFCIFRYFLRNNKIFLQTVLLALLW